MKRRLEELLNMKLDGALDSSESHDLNTLLSDDKNLEEYVEFLNLHALLEWEVTENSVKKHDQNSA